MAKLRLTFSRGLAAAELWRFGEDRLAYAALGFSDEELEEAWQFGAEYYDPSVPLPVPGPRVTNGHVICFACMKTIEGDIRPLARQRRKPHKLLPADLVVAPNEHDATNRSPGPGA